MRELHRGLKRLSGWQKGLLVAANNAQLCIYGTSSLSQNEVYQIRESVRTASEKLLYHAALEAEQGVRGEISNVQTSYLQLREKLATLRGFFVLFKQHELFADLVNDALCRKGKGVSTILDCALSDRRNVIGGELELRTENNAPPCFEISVSDDLKKDVYELIDTITENTRELKRAVDWARRLVVYSSVNLKPYEEYLDGIEGKMRDLLRRAKCDLYSVDSEDGPEMRATLEKIDDEHVKFVEALPDY